jgi:hypothetical protein
VRVGQLSKLVGSGADLRPGGWRVAGVNCSLWAQGARPWSGSQFRSFPDGLKIARQVAANRARLARDLWSVSAFRHDVFRWTRLRRRHPMYRDLWRLHVVAAIGLVCGLGLAGDEASQGHGGKAALCIHAAVACLGVLIAPLFLKRSAKRRSGPLGATGDRDAGQSSTDPGVGSPSRSDLRTSKALTCSRDGCAFLSVGRSASE